MASMKIDALLVSSCDKYGYLWPEWHEWWQKNWQLDCPTYLITGCEDPALEGVQAILTGTVPWTDCLYRALERLKSDGVEHLFFSLDDNFFRKLWPPDYLAPVYELFSDWDMDCLRFHGITAIYKLHPTDEKVWFCDVWRVDPKSAYIYSAQPAIWDIDVLMNTLLPGKNPWEQELQCRTSGLTYAVDYVPCSNECLKGVRK